jgi:hypothetical protein
MRTLIKKILLYREKKRKTKEAIINILKHAFISIVIKKNTSITLSCLGIGKNERATKTLTWKNVIVFNETKQITVRKFLKKVYKEMTQKRKSLDEIMNAKITGFSDDINKVLNKFKLAVKQNDVTIDLLDETGTVIFRGARQNVQKYTNFINKSVRERKALVDAMYKRIASKSNKYNPQNAIAKGFDDIPISRNGRGVSPDFDGLTHYLYEGNIKFGKIKIKITGSRSKDFKAANELAGLKKTPKEYTWHHLDDLDHELNGTMQLVKSAAHDATITHVGSANQFNKLFNIIEDYL